MYPSGPQLANYSSSYCSIYRYLPPEGSLSILLDHPSARPVPSDQALSRRQPPCWKQDPSISRGVPSRRVKKTYAGTRSGMRTLADNTSEKARRKKKGGRRGVTTGRVNIHSLYYICTHFVDRSKKVKTRYTFIYTISSLEEGTLSKPNSSPARTTSSSYASSRFCTLKSEIFEQTHTYERLIAKSMSETTFNVTVT